MSQAEEAERAIRAAEVLRHLADPTRLHLLRLLTEGPSDVSTLTARVEASRSSVSQHLGRLRLAGLVRADRDGRHMHYRLTSDHLHRLIDEVHDFADHIVRQIPHHTAWPAPDKEGDGHTTGWQGTAPGSDRNS